MTKETCEKVEAICDQLLGKEGMDKYPWLLVIGLLFVAFSLRKHKTRLAGL
jgi:hypothetical protein